MQSLFVCFLLSASLLKAYSCGPVLSTPCSYLNPSAVVFKGRVLDSRPNHTPGPRPAGEHTRIVRFEVLEGLYNIESGGQVNVFTTISANPGFEMLVISNRMYNNELSLTTCIANQTGLHEAMERYIRQNQQQAHKLSSLEVTITSFDKGAKARVALQGPESRVENTNDSGKLSFENLPVGQYKIEAFSDGYQTPARQSKVTISPFSCQSHYISLQGIFTLTATVRSADGLPVSGIPVELSKTDSENRFIGRAVSGPQANLNFTSLGPGEYTLKTMPALQPEIEWLPHPSEITRVKIGSEPAPAVQLHAYSRQRVLATLKFVTPSGAPLPNLKILAAHKAAGTTDSEGRLKIPILEYASHQIRFTSNYGASKWETIEATSPARTVVMFPY
jgi:hypothetical protein